MNAATNKILLCLPPTDTARCCWLRQLCALSLANASRQQFQQLLTAGTLVSWNTWHSTASWLPDHKTLTPPDLAQDPMLQMHELPQRSIFAQVQPSHGDAHEYLVMFESFMLVGFMCFQVLQVFVDALHCKCRVGGNHRWGKHFQALPTKASRSAA